MDKQEIKILFAGPVGAGKTTAIGTVSDVAVVSTEAMATDETALRKETTTVALDYGEVAVNESHVLRLYGTPGQERFSFMWEMLAQGALGIVLLIDNSRVQALDDFALYLEHFGPLARDSAMVVGITRAETGPYSLDDYYRLMERRNECYPLITADPRRREDVLMLLDNLFTLLEEET